MVEQKSLNSIHHDIRNMRALSNEQLSIIDKLSDIEKMNIINLLNQSIQAFNHLLLDGRDDTSNSTIHTRK